MQEIDALLKKEVATHKTPSVQYLFFNSQQVQHHMHYGLATIANEVPVDAHTTYHAYSMTKTFTALAVLQLAEQNKVDLEQPAYQYIPDFPYGKDITVRQLLTHTAGIANPIPLRWIHQASEHATFDQDHFFKAVFARHNKLKSKRNTHFAYTNLGYILLGWLIENVSGMTYEMYITENIIQKLNLQADSLGFEIPNVRKHATGYHRQASVTNLLLGFFLDKKKYMDKAEDGWKPFKNFYVNGTAYGGLIGTPGAFVTYVQELLKTDCSLLSETYKKMLFTENHTIDNNPTGMCLSWFTGMLNGKQYFTHAGGGGGYYCEIRIYPDAHAGSAIFFNRTGMSDERFLDKVDTFFI